MNMLMKKLDFLYQPDAKTMSMAVWGIESFIIVRNLKDENTAMSMTVLVRLNHNLSVSLLLVEFKKICVY